MIQSFCIVLVTNNIEHQLSFYKGVLGLNEFFYHENTIGLGIDGRLFVVLRVEDNPNSHHGKENKGPIIITFQINIEHRDTIISRLYKGGYAIRDKLSLPQYDSEYVFVEDADGNEVCLDFKSNINML